MNLYGVIMAGGSGTRFWPLSRESHPKQLLRLSGNEYMINEAIDRLSYTVESENILVVTSKALESPVKKITSSRILPGNLLKEPSARNTAACIGYAAMEILRKHGDGVMIVTPSDAWIKDTPAFTRTLAQAVEAVRKENRLVTIGIRPTFASTGYGYIRYDQKSGAAARSVAEFREKPDSETAQAYLSSGEYMWNSGMFIWKASTILSHFERLAPDIYACLCQIGDAMNTDDEYAVLEEIYPKIRSISIDYAIMEPAAAQGNVLMVPGAFGWSDIGSWDALHALHPADQNGNILVCDAMAVDTQRCLLYSTGRLVAALGVEDLVIVDTQDAVLVCKKDKVQEIRHIVSQLKNSGRSELL